MPGAPSVGIDAVAAARQAVNHLLHLRHRRIGLIIGEADDPRFEFVSSAERRRGCEEALQAAGLTLPEELVATGPHGLEGGAEAMAELLSRPMLPTAVFAEYDELAIGALWALRRAGLSVPGDISVVSIDDHEMAAMFDLTTIAQDVGAAGRDRRPAAAAGPRGRGERPTGPAGAGADPVGAARDDRTAGGYGQAAGAHPGAPPPLLSWAIQPGDVRGVERVPRRSSS